MKTVTVQIGNSDNKLSQGEWSRFYRFTEIAINRHAHRVHFSGAAYSADPWQNAAWVFTLLGNTDQLKRELAAICLEFKQDSIAWTEGETEFIAKEETPFITSRPDCPTCGKQMIFNNVWGSVYCQRCKIGGYLSTYLVANLVAAAKGES